MFGEMFKKTNKEASKGEGESSGETPTTAGDRDGDGRAHEIVMEEAPGGSSDEGKGKKKKDERDKGKKKAVLFKSHKKKGNIQEDDGDFELTNANAILVNLQRIYHYYANTSQGQVIVDEINSNIEDKESHIGYNTSHKKWRPHILDLLRESRKIVERGQRDLDTEKELATEKSKKNKKEQASAKVISERVQRELINVIRQAAHTIEEAFFTSEKDKCLANSLYKLSDAYASENVKREQEDKGKEKEKDQERSDLPKLPAGILILKSPAGKKFEMAEDVKDFLAKILLCTDYYLNTSRWQEFNSTVIEANPSQRWADVAKRLSVMTLRLYLQKPEDAKPQLIKILDAFAREIRDGMFGKNSQFATTLEFISQQIADKQPALPEENRFIGVLAIANSEVTPSFTAKNYIQKHILFHVKDLVLEYQMLVANRWKGTSADKIKAAKELENFLERVGETQLDPQKVIQLIEAKFNRIESGYKGNPIFRENEFGKMRGRIFAFMATVSDELFPPESELIPEKYTIPKVK